MDKKITKDENNYRQMSIPFNTVDEANVSAQSFFDEVGELRKKHKLRDVLVVINGSVVHPDGEEGEFMVHGNYGSTLNVVGMAAYVYGIAKQEQDEKLSKLLSAKKK